MKIKVVLGLAALTALLLAVLMGLYFWKALSYQRYASVEKPLNILFDYPKGWRLKSEKGKIEKYSQLLIMGPRNQRQTYTASFEIRASPLKKDGGRFGSVIELRSHYLEHLYRNPQILSQSKLFFSENPAEEVVASYTIPPLRLEGLKSEEIPVKIRTIFFRDYDYLYQITYTVDSREYDLFRKEFDHLLKSFQFAKA